MNPTTQQSAHTAGPWRTNGSQVTARGDWKAPVCVVLSKEDVRPTPDAAAQTLSEAHANARLIAAAPELLEAARNAANVLAALATGQLTEITRDSNALAMLRAAIARATGN